jgi:4-hydroxythreonine-4-phosphate dehydrogenase
MDRVATPHRPLIALAMGDPAGISPELTARLLADAEIRAEANIVAIGDLRILAEGATVAGIELDVEVCQDFRAPTTCPIFVDLGHLDGGVVKTGMASAEGGRFALANFRRALELAMEGHVAAVCFTPFNKISMKMADAGYGDEITFTADFLSQTRPASEFNILDGALWNARVTSHVPLKDVAAQITHKSVLGAIRLTQQSMRRAGFVAPRLAVAALNPHAGDGGNFGREEIEIIGPAVEQARTEQLLVEGPFPSDTVFLRAQRGAFDAVVTMYHDQGQIAMKLMGFERGVTYLGGFPFPICTAAHGTAYDIAGQGKADAGAIRAAVRLAIQLATKRPEGAP